MLIISEYYIRTLSGMGDEARIVIIEKAAAYG